MARRASTVTALIAAILGLILTTSIAQAASAMRTSSFVYDPASGLLKKEIIEPGNSQLCLVTEYEYDTFGNKTKVTTRNCDGSAGEAAAPAAGTDGVIAKRSTSSTYDTRGQFPLTTTNALNHSETRTFDPKFGGLASLKGPNGLTTSWDYDSFGRKRWEWRADAAYTYTLPFTFSCPGCFGITDIKYAIYSFESPGTGSYVFYDSLNRKVLSYRSDMSGKDYVAEYIQYDINGRINKASVPYKLLVTPAFNVKYTSFEYDILGRVIKATAPDGGITTKAYDGLTTKVTNAKGQVTTTVKNTQGQTVRVTDAMSKSIYYSYDPFGNLTRTIDALSNVTWLYYDIRGRKIQMIDPDMGTWYYNYNALGELVRQKDAKWQIVTMTYDLLGRMTKRSEPDLISSWTYDTAANGIGKLASATSGNGYSRTHSYDALGRLSSTSTVIDDPAKPYVTKTSYGSRSQVDTQTYPASPGHPTGFAVKNIYSLNGYLIKVVNAADTTKVYWQADAMDAMGHLTQQTYGNGLVTQQTYYADTGRLKEQFAGAGNAVQNMSYTYDSLGNLSTREDKNQFLTETYTYDTLNRVKTANSISGAVNVTNSFAYDAIGNITCKSDISTCSDTAANYSYYAWVPWNPTCQGKCAARRLPHAVSYIAGTINGTVNPSFRYDSNGNMTSGAGRSITWTSFNMPSQITNGAKTTSFLYNPEHERTIENQADGSKVVALSPRYDTGLHFEKKLISNPATKKLTGEVEYEHYLYAGGQMFGKYVTVTATDGVTLASAKTTYYSKDHLGSIVAITDEAGNIATDGSGQLARYSYDVWGKRRKPNGEADPNGLLNNPDMYHGYTGHEMLDDVGLIHMNGRLYDPLTGRFMSADPHIQDPLNLQSYNRYAYCMGNPMICNDPSGYFSLGSFFRTVVAIAVAVYAPQISASLGWTGGYITSAAGTTALAGGASASLGLSGAVASGMLGGAMAGGIMGGNLKSAIVGGATGGMFGAVGDKWATGTWQNVVGHAGVGCASGTMSGGGCGSGALSAGVSAAATPFVSGFGTIGGTMASAVIGGTASVIGGGKFANGAQTGAFGYLFNCLAHQSCAKNMLRDSKGGYYEDRMVDGNQYRIRLNGLCATTQCVTNGANLDMNDLGTKEWQKALNVKMAGDVGKIASGGVILAGTGTGAVVAGGVGVVAAGAEYAMSGNPQVPAAAATGTVAAQWLQRYGMPEPLANRAGEVISNIFGN